MISATEPDESIRGSVRLSVGRSVSPSVHPSVTKYFWTVPDPVCSLTSGERHSKTANVSQLLWRHNKQDRNDSPAGVPSSLLR